MDNVLLVDDDPEVLSALERVLAPRYRVYTALSAPQAEKLLERVEVKVVVADYYMPEEDGLTFFAGLRQRFPKTQRILLTGGSERDVLLRAINEGDLYRYLLKPPNITELLNIVHGATVEYDRQRQLDIVSKEHAIYRQTTGAPTGLRAAAEVPIEGLRKGSGLLMSGMLAIFTMVAVFAIVAFIALMVMYFFKSEAGVDFFPKFHLGDSWSDRSAPPSPGEEEPGLPNP
ncbi:MAG: response regulator [Lentisphaeria bacterium]